MKTALISPLLIASTLLTGAAFADYPANCPTVDAVKSAVLIPTAYVFYPAPYNEAAVGFNLAADMAPKPSTPPVMVMVDGYESTKAASQATALNDLHSLAESTVPTTFQAQSGTFCKYTPGNFDPTDPGNAALPSIIAAAKK